MTAQSVSCVQTFALLSSVQMASSVARQLAGSAAATACDIRTPTAGMAINTQTHNARARLPIAMVVALVGADDRLHQLMTDDVLSAKHRKLDTFDLRQQALHLDQT